MNILPQLFWLHKLPDGANLGFSTYPWLLQQYHSSYRNTPRVAGAFLRVLCDSATEREELCAAPTRDSGFLSSEDLSLLFPVGNSFRGGVILRMMAAVRRVGCITVNSTCMDYFLDLRVLDIYGDPSLRSPDDFLMLRDSVPKVFARFLDDASKYLQGESVRRPADKKIRRPVPPRTHAQNRNHLWIQKQNETAGLQG